jgi:hypothetical protein
MARLSLLARAGLSTLLLASFVRSARADDDVNRVPIRATRQGTIVLAWNDLGMHCLNPTYDKDVILPPYNTLWAQVVVRGNPPRVLTSGYRVSYSIVGNTYSYGKGSYGQFWDNALTLFGVSLERDKGLNLAEPDRHNGLRGDMVAVGTTFQAHGIPVVPVSDSGAWNPYQVAVITVRNAAGATVAQTRATIPTSDEIRCDKCHGGAVRPYLEIHDRNHGTHLDGAPQPFMCASCHGSPVLKAPGKPGVKYLSQAVHGLHGRVQPMPGCYDCHPGQKTQCNRSLAHTDSAGACTKCHGSLQQVASSIASGRVPWANEPACVSCHTGVAGVNTGTTLYRNAPGHGGVACAGCHGSPHAMVPSRLAADNYQAAQYQTTVNTIGSCGTCHVSSRGEGGSEVAEKFASKHGGTHTDEPTACHVCHTAVSSNLAKWPHSFQWRSR